MKKVKKKSFLLGHICSQQVKIHRCTILFAPILMVIFVVSKSKYIGVRSFKAIGGVSLSESIPSLTYILNKKIRNQCVN